MSLFLSALTYAIASKKTAITKQISSNGNRNRRKKLALAVINLISKHEDASEQRRQSGSKTGGVGPGLKTDGREP